MIREANGFGTLRLFIIDCILIDYRNMSNRVELESHRNPSKQKMQQYANELFTKVIIFLSPQSGQNNVFFSPPPTPPPPPPPLT